MTFFGSGRVAAGRPIAALVVGAISLTILTGCGTEGKSGEPRDGRATQTPRGDPNEHSQIDIDFAQMMIVHTRQSSDLLALVEARTNRTDIIELAEEMRADDATNIEVLTDLLAEWDVEVPDEITLTAMDHSAMDHEGIGMGFMAGISDDQVTLLSGLSGAAFDRMFLKFILTHRGAAVAMAQSERLYGQFGDAIRVARSIESTQAAQMDTIFEIRRSA